MTHPKPTIFYMPPADTLPGSASALLEPAPDRAPQLPPPIPNPDVQLSDDIVREVATLAAARPPRRLRLRLLFLRAGAPN